MQIPTEQLVPTPEQLVPIDPQLLKSNKVLTQFPDGVRAYGETQLARKSVLRVIIQLH